MTCFFLKTMPLLQISQGQNRWRAQDNISRVGPSRAVCMKSSSQVGWQIQIVTFIDTSPFSKPSSKEMAGGVTPSSRQSSRATVPSGFMFSPTKNWWAFEISKVVLGLLCSPCHKSLYFCWPLSFKIPFDCCHVILDILPLVFFREAGLLLVMVQDDVNTSDYGAFGTFALGNFRGGISTNNQIIIVAPCPTDHLPLYLQAQLIWDLDCVTIGEHLISSWLMRSREMIVMEAGRRPKRRWLSTAQSWAQSHWSDAKGDGERNGLHF